MEFCKKILDWALLIAKIIFTIVLIIIGIRLIAFLLTPFFLVSIPIFSFTSFDWNPLATLIGSIVTAVATFCAVYLTSHEDRKARKIDYNERLYRDKLFILNDFIPFLESINYLYFSKEKFTKFKNNHILIKNDLKKLKEIESIFSYLKLLLPDSIYANFSNIQLYSYKKVLEYLEKDLVDGAEINPQLFIDEFQKHVNDRNSRDEDEKEYSEIDYTNKQNLIDKIKTEIVKELNIGK